MNRAVLFAMFIAASRVDALAPEADATKYADRGRWALSQRRWAEAAEAYDELRKLTPETAEVHAQLGMIYFQLRDFHRAVSALQEARRLKRGIPNVEPLLAISLSEIGRHEQALPGLRNGFEQTSDTMLRRVTGLQLQRSYTGVGRDDDAVDVARELTRLFPEDPEILYHTGKIFSNYAYLVTARLAEIAPTSAWKYLAAGEASESLSDYDAALADYRKVLELAPERPGIHYRLGRVHLARGRPPLAEADAEANAVREFIAELQMDPTNADAACELGELRRKAGDLEGAQAFFAQAVEHYPDFAQGLVGLARVLIAQSRPDRALLHLDRAVRLDPRDDAARFQLWRAHQALGHSEEARKAQAEFKRLRDRRHEEERLGLLRRGVHHLEVDGAASPNP